MDQYETMYVPDHKYHFEYSSTERVYFCPDGVHLLTYRTKSGNLTCGHVRIYTWNDFKITSFFFEKNSHRKGIIKRFTFVLNGVPYPDKLWDEMIHILQNRVCDTPNRKNLILNLLNQYIEHEEIPERKIADVVGFTENGWQLPDKYYFVPGNDIRESIEEDIRKMIEKPVLSQETITNFVRKMYEITSISYKDYIFAYGFIAVFLFALRTATKLMPFLALGGPGGKGKTAIEEFFTVKMWGNIPEIIGSAIMEAEPRVQGTLTGSTMPVCIDDCQDLKDFVTGIFKRYTTAREKVKKLNPDQTKKMDCEYCSPVMMTFNALPRLFEDPQFRQRVILLDISEVKQNEEWLTVYNSIENGAIGRYIIEITRNMSFEELLRLYQKMDNMGLKDNRQKTIARIMNLGKHFAKEWFGLELNISKLPDLISQTLQAGNEQISDLIKDQIRESADFIQNDGGIWVNPNPRSWVVFPVRSHDIRLPETKQLAKGYLYTTENAIDLAKRLNKNTKEISLKTLALLLQTEWKSIKEGTFWTPLGSKRGIFIPYGEMMSSLEHVSGEIVDNPFEVPDIASLTPPEDNAISKYHSNTTLLNSDFIPLEIKEKIRGEQK